MPAVRRLAPYVIFLFIASCGPEKPVPAPLPWTDATGINYAVLSEETNAHMSFRLLSATSPCYMFEKIVFYPVPHELKSLLVQEIAKLRSDEQDQWRWLAVSRAHYWSNGNPQLMFWVTFPHKNELWIAARKEPGSNEGEFCRIWMVREERSNRVDHGLELCVSVRKFPELYKRLVRTYGKLGGPQRINLDRDVFE